MKKFTDRERAMRRVDCDDASKGFTARERAVLDAWSEYNQPALDDTFEASVLDAVHVAAALDDGHKRNMLNAVDAVIEAPVSDACTERPMPSTRSVILFLPANPHSNKLSIREEWATIERGLKMSPHGDDFRLELRCAVTADEVIRYVNELVPTVIHFSGHGDGEHGLCLQGEHGQSQPVPARSLEMIVGAAMSNLRLVVLSGCYSTMQAEALSQLVDCVVGTTGAIGDSTARAFSSQLYSALGNGHSIRHAVKQATVFALQAADRGGSLPQVAKDTRFGTVKWFHDAKGFGIIHDANGGDVFVRHSTIAAEGFHSLVAGQTVDYDEEHKGN